MEKNVVVVGGGPAGIISALTVKSVYPDKTVCLIKEIGDGVVPCAIPYMMDTLPNPSSNLVPDTPLENAGVEVVVDRVTSLDTEAQTINLKSAKPLTYERLVLATGSKTILPPIPGVDKAGVYTVEKSLASMEKLREVAKKAKKLVIIGGGFIGAEFADELSRLDGLEIHLIEVMPRLLISAFDDDICDDIQQVLAAKGVKIHLGSRVESIDGDDRVNAVTLDKNEKIEADLVLVSIGAKPNSDLAKHAGMRITDNGAIWVDDYMRTKAKGVFAVGDCALKRDFFTRQAVPIWLASTATAEARIAGTNMYDIRVLRQIQGTIAAFSTNIGGISFASAGMTERNCIREGFRPVTATTEAPNRHPGAIPGASNLKVKLIFADRSGILLGGQMSGGESVGELVNVLALGIEKRVTVREIDMMQFATHPLLTAAPTVHPFINSAHAALAKMRASFK